MAIRRAPMTSVLSETTARSCSRRRKRESAHDEPRLRRIMFMVDDVDDVVARLRSHGGELVGEIAEYEDIYRLCFVRGPEGIIIGLSEQLS